MTTNDADEIAFSAATSTLSRLRGATTEATVSAICREAEKAVSCTAGLPLSFCLGTYGAALCLLAAEVQASAIAAGESRDEERRPLLAATPPPERVRMYPDGGFAGGTFEAPKVADIKRCVEHLKAVQVQPDDNGVYTFLMFASEADRKAYEEALRARGEALPKGMVLTP